MDREGRAWLEGEFLLFRGADYRLKIPLVPVPKLRVEDGRLQIGLVTLHLGARAEKWAEQIAHPKSLVEKLGVKAGQSVVALGMEDTSFLAEKPGTRLKQNLDFVFLGAGSPAALDRLTKIRESLAPAGAVWIVYPKGSKTITQNDVMSATKAAGLVDVKVAAFSATHTALKAVIPKLARSAPASAGRGARR